MPRNVMKDKSLERVEAASRKASAKGSGSAGGKLNPVEFAPGTAEIYNKRSKR